MRHLFAICKKTDIYLGKKYFFVCTTLPGRGQNMVRVMSWMFFLGPKTQFSDQKSVFYHMTLNYVNGPFVALREMVHFAPWDWFFNFSFLSYGRFRWRTKKSSPTPLWGHCLPVTALATPPPECAQPQKLCTANFSSGTLKTLINRPHRLIAQKGQFLADFPKKNGQNNRIFGQKFNFFLRK